MDDAEAKENRPSTPTSYRKPSTSRTVGSGSTWGDQERSQFKINTNDDVIHVHELIEENWFDFTTMTPIQINSYPSYCLVLTIRN